MHSKLPFIEFEKGLTGKILEEFKGKGYSAHKVDLIYRAVCPLKMHEWSQLVDDVVGNAKFLPTVNDFRTKTMALLERRQSEQKKEFSGNVKRLMSNEDESNFFKVLFRAMGETDPEKSNDLFKKINARLAQMEKAHYRCSMCRDSGHVEAQKRGAPSGANYVFKCTCSMGASAIENFPVWNNRFLNDFYPINRKDMTPLHVVKE